MSSVSGNTTDWLFEGEDSVRALTYEKWKATQHLDPDTELFDHTEHAVRHMFILPKIISQCQLLFRDREPDWSLESIVLSALKPIVEAFPDTSKSPAFLNREYPSYDEPFEVKMSTSDSFITDHYCRGARVYSRKLSRFAKVRDPDLLLCPFISAYSPLEPCSDYQGPTRCYDILGRKPVSVENPPIYELHDGDCVRTSYYPSTSSCTEISMEREDVEMAQRVLMHKHSCGGHAQSPAAIQREVRNAAFKESVENSSLINEKDRERTKFCIAQYAMCPAPDCPYCLLMMPIPWKHQEVSADQILACLEKFCHRCVPGISDRAFSDACYLNNTGDSFAPLHAEELSDFTISRDGNFSQVSPQLSELELELYNRHVDSDHFPMRIIVLSEPRFTKCRSIRCNLCMRGFISVRDYALCSKHPNGFVPADWARRMPTNYLNAAPVPSGCVCDSNDSTIGQDAMERLDLYGIQEIVAEVKEHVVSVHRDYAKLVEDHGFPFYLYDLSRTLVESASGPKRSTASMEARQRSKALQVHALEISSVQKFVAAYKDLRERGQGYKISFDIPCCPQPYRSFLNESDNLSGVHE